MEPATAALLTLIVTTAGTAASVGIAASEDGIPKPDIFAPDEDSIGEARAQQKRRAAARFGNQKTILAGGNEQKSGSLGSPTLVGG